MKVTLKMIIIRNVTSAENQHIRMISEGSCDTEDCSNDAENSALSLQNILKHIKSYFQFYQYFTILLFLLYF